MKNKELLKIHGALEAILKNPNPIQFATAANIKKLKQHFDIFEERKEELFRKYVNLDKNGEPIIKEEVKKKIQGKTVQLSYFDFEWKTDNRVTFFKELDKLNEMELAQEVALMKVDVSKKIKVSDTEEKTLKDLIEIDYKIPSEIILDLLDVVFVGYENL